MDELHFLDLINIKKSFSDATILDNFNLHLEKNQFVTLLGPSGCGKTTILRIIGGFETPEEGSVIFKGDDITFLPPHKRNINTVFQKYSLFPHMNIYDNIAFGLRIKKTPEDEIKKEVEKALDFVNLPGIENRRSDSLSGGQQQRVAIARAIVNKPDVLLFDEPLGALDLKLRQEMQIEIKNFQKELGISFIYVTHDQEEALTMSDKIVVMSQGKIQQIGTPIDIYNEPINAFVANFIGESNIVPGIMEQDFKVEFSKREFVCVDKRFENKEVNVVVRPEDIKLVKEEDGMLKGIVQSVFFKGVHYEMTILTDDGTSWLVHSTLCEKEGSRVGLNILPDDIHIMRKVAE